MCLKTAEWIDPDPALCSVVSDLGLHCLFRPVCQNTQDKYCHAVCVCIPAMGYIITFNKCWMNDKQLRTWSDAAECSIWSGSKLFDWLRFYGPVNPLGSCRARSVYLTTLFLDSHSPLSCFFTFIPVPLASLSLSFISSTISSISFLPFSGRQHKMTHKGGHVDKPKLNQSIL